MTQRLRSRDPKGSVQKKRFKQAGEPRQTGRPQTAGRWSAVHRKRLKKRPLLNILFDKVVIHTESLNMAV